MFAKEDLIYRQIFTLKDGTRVLVRPLNHDDRQSLLDFFLPVSQEDKAYMRHDVNNPAVINSWIDQLDYNKILPLVAVVNNHFVGCATLHFHEGPYRHRAEIRIYLGKELRQRGVGSRMLQSQIEVARKRGLHAIEVEILSERASVIKSFHNLGFKTAAVLEDYWQMPDGDLRDVNLLVFRLRTNLNEF